MIEMMLGWILATYQFVVPPSEPWVAASDAAGDAYERAVAEHLAAVEPLAEVERAEADLFLAQAVEAKLTLEMPYECNARAVELSPRCLTVLDLPGQEVAPTWHPMLGLPAAPSEEPRLALHPWQSLAEQHASLDDLIRSRPLSALRAVIELARAAPPEELVSLDVAGVVAVVADMKPRAARAAARELQNIERAAREKVPFEPSFEGHVNPFEGRVWSLEGLANRD